MFDVKVGFIVLRSFREDFAGIAGTGAGGGWEMRSLLSW